MSSYRRKCATFLHVGPSTYECCKFCNWAQSGRPQVNGDFRGMQLEYFYALKLSFSDLHTKHGLTAFSEYTALFAANELPVWCYYAVTACMLTPIIKELVVNPA